MACCPCCCTQQNGVCCGTGEEKVCCKAPRECCTVYEIGVGESDVCCTDTQYCCNDGQGVCCEVGEVCCVGDEGAVCCESNVVCCAGVCCAEGQCCVDDACVPCDCESDEDCPEGECCNDGVCGECGECGVCTRYVCQVFEVTGLCDYVQVSVTCQTYAECTSNGTIPTLAEAGNCTDVGGNCEPAGGQAAEWYPDDGSCSEQFSWECDPATGVWTNNGRTDNCPSLDLLYPTLPCPNEENILTNTTTGSCCGADDPP